MLLIVLLALAGLVAAAAFTPTTHWVESGKGFVITEKEAEIRSSVEGAVKHLDVRDGALVQKGQSLIQLEDSVERAAYDQARDRLRAIKESLEEMRFEQELDRAQRKERVSRIKLRREVLRNELEKMEKAGSGVFSTQELATARLKVDMVRSELVELELPRDELMAKQIKVLQEQIEAASKSVILAKAQLGLRMIRSPLNGIVYFNRCEPGEVVKATDVLGQVFDHSSWIVRLELPEWSIDYVCEGQAVKVELAARSSFRHGYIPATVSKVTPVITPQATGDGRFVVEARINEPGDLKLKSGMQARANVNTGQTTWLLRLSPW